MESQAAHTHPKNTQVPPLGVVYRRIFVKIFISASGFCYHNKLHKIKSDWISATSCCDKILLWRQRSSQKFSGTHKVFYHCNVSHNLSPDLNTRSHLLLLCVIATCCLVCPNLWSLDSQAQLPLLLTQSCCPPTYSYVWAWTIYLPAPGTMASPSIFFSYPRLNMGNTHSQAKTLWTRFSKFRQIYICCHALLNRSSKVNIMLNEDATVKGKDWTSSAQFATLLLVIKLVFRSARIFTKCLLLGADQCEGIFCLPSNYQRKQQTC